MVFCGIDVSTAATCYVLESDASWPSRFNLRSVSWMPTFASLHPARCLICFHSTTHLHLENGSTRGPSRRVTDNLWLASGDSACRNGASPTLDDVQTWISDLPAEFAHVVISAPPIGLYTDAALLGQTADGVVLVLEANSTRRVAALKAKLALDASNIRVLGTVLNNRRFPIPERIYRLL